MTRLWRGVGFVVDYLVGEGRRVRVGGWEVGMAGGRGGDWEMGGWVWWNGRRKGDV